MEKPDYLQWIAEAISCKYEQDPKNKAFEKLVRNFQDMIFGYIYALCGDLDKTGDLTQETFIIAYQNLENLREALAFPAWIKKIAKGEFLRMMKKSNNLESPLENPDWEKSRTHPPDKELINKESKEIVHTAIKRLPETQRIPLVLYYINGYSQKEISDFLSIEIAAVKKRLQRGRENLRKDFMTMIEDNLKDIRPSKNNDLISKLNLYTTFETAARNGQITILEQMIVDGIDINQRDARGKTLLHWAVDNKHVEAVILLLNNKVDTKIPDKAGHTALDLAKKTKQRPIIKLLQDYENKEKK